MPLKKNLSPFKSAPQTKPFNLNGFLENLHKTGLLFSCEIKGNLKGLLIFYI